MRMSCNGCRVLRKGCSDDCSIRPCLQWIKNPDHQANATVFLAKFYGRAGLLNLLRSAPDHLRPAVFRSLLYEACGRIVNPVYGSVGLLWSGNWQLCQTAVDAVLRGAPIDPAAAPPDIRHVAKGHPSSSSDRLHRVSGRSRFKRSVAAEAIGDPIDLENLRLVVPADSSATGSSSGGSEGGAVVELDLTLGLEMARRADTMGTEDDGEVGVELGLELAA